MLAEQVVEWTREPKQESFEKGFVEGFKEGYQAGRLETLERIRRALVRHLEERFGPLPVSARERLQEMDCVKQMLDLCFRITKADSLDALGLA